MPKAAPHRDTSIEAYRSKRNFAATSEPAPSAPKPGQHAPLFVVQKHAAKRAGLHWDFRLEHGGVLWSWAVRKGPSLDPKDRRLAAHVEDHPLDYADFQGTIPEGQYGAGTVETWDRGSWAPIGDAETGMKKGDLHFALHGQRLKGRFHLVRLKRRERDRQDAWFLIKGHDEHERPSVDAPTLEAEIPFNAAPPGSENNQAQAPPPGAMRSVLPKTQQPQLCSVAEAPPEGAGWISEIKFDGYRMLVWIERGEARLVTRNGHDWTTRLPRLAGVFAALPVETALLDGEMVALRRDGVSSFHDLQSALSEGRDDQLFFFLFDLLHLNGWDLRPCALLDRKRALSMVADWHGALRYSDHLAGDPASMRRQACAMGLEGIICKQADAPYRPGRGDTWLKVKCRGREEFVVLGWTPPGGKRPGLGSLHVGYYDDSHRLHYAGGVGSGFTEQDLQSLRAKLEPRAADMPTGLLVSGDPLNTGIHWVRPELVVELQYTAWSGEGRLRHPVYLGLCEDKSAEEVVRDVPDPEVKRTPVSKRQGARGTVAHARRSPAVIPPLPQPDPIPARARGAVVIARAPKRSVEVVGGVTLTHADRQLWPGMSKLELAAYWQAVAAAALPGLAHRPLGIVRCPEGIEGQRFFQKRTEGLFPPQVRDGAAEGSPYLALDDADGLVAMAQMSAIELHAWGAREPDPLHPDWIVFDLDPGEGVPWAEVVRSAHAVRERLGQLGLASFCRTTGGKGLHVVVPLTPSTAWDWDRVKTFCRAFAELMTAQEPERYVAHVKIADRRGRILIDWLRNTIGNTAIASFCPRARPGAMVATPLAWDEVNPKLDPSQFTLRTVPDRLAKLNQDPWRGFFEADQYLPDLSLGHRKDAARHPAPANPDSTPRARVVYAPKHRTRSR